MNGSNAVEKEELAREQTDGPSIEVDRRTFMKTVGLTAAAVGMSSGSALAAEGDDTHIEDELAIDYGHDLAHDPRRKATITVDVHEKDFSQLEYVADDEDVVSLEDHGYVLAEREDMKTVHNPVTIRAADFVTPEYSAFPRGATYDDDADSETDEVDVEWHEKDHWTLTQATNGSLALSEVANDGLTFEATGVAAGETVSATFDLSTVASEDATITDGIARKFLQLVDDVEALTSGAIVEIALGDSTGNEVVAKIDSTATDATAVDVLATTTETSAVHEVRVGELQDAQAVTLADLQTVTVRVKEADATITLHGFNAQRASEWEFGEQEVADDADPEMEEADDDDEVEVITVTQPAGEFSITSLDSIPAPLDSAEIHGVTYDLEQRASHLPADRVHVRVEDSPDAYDRPKVVEHVVEWETPTAYALDVTTGAVEDTVALPSSRYLGVEVATGINEVDEWEDVEDSISWTDKSDLYTSVGEDVELLASTSSQDRTGYRVRTLHSEESAKAVTTSSSGAAVIGVTGGSGGSGGINPMSILMGVTGALAVIFRKHLGFLMFWR